MDTGGAATNFTATQKQVEQVTYLPNKVYSSGKLLPPSCSMSCCSLHLICTFDDDNCHIYCFFVLVVSCFLFQHQLRVKVFEIKI